MMCAMTDKKDCMTMEQAEQIPGIGKSGEGEAQAEEQ